MFLTIAKLFQLLVHVGELHHCTYMTLLTLKKLCTRWGFFRVSNQF